MPHTYHVKFRHEKTHVSLPFDAPASLRDLDRRVRQLGRVGTMPAHGARAWTIDYYDAKTGALLLAPEHGAAAALPNGLALMMRRRPAEVLPELHVRHAVSAPRSASRY